MSFSWLTDVDLPVSSGAPAGRDAHILDGVRRWVREVHKDTAAVGGSLSQANPPSRPSQPECPVDVHAAQNAAAVYLLAGALLTFPQTANLVTPSANYNLIQTSAAGRGAHQSHVGVVLRPHLWWKWMWHVATLERFSKCTRGSLVLHNTSRRNK